jgi:GNAT superfamily N-acetyltransferase
MKETRLGSKQTNLKVRPAVVRDIKTLVHQRHAMWNALGIRDRKLHEEADRTYAIWARKHLNDSSLKAWIVETYDGKIAGGGCLWLHPVQPRPGGRRQVQPYLLSMYTEPSYRRRGVASIIVQEAIDWSQENQYERLLLHASESGRKVYRKFGFTRTWEMRLKLPISRKRRMKR